MAFLGSTGSTGLSGKGNQIFRRLSPTSFVVAVLRKRSGGRRGGATHFPITHTTHYSPNRRPHCSLGALSCLATQYRPSRQDLWLTRRLCFACSVRSPLCFKFAPTVELATAIPEVYRHEKCITRAHLLMRPCPWRSRRGKTST